MHTHDLSPWTHEHVFDAGSAAAERGTKAVMWITAVMMVVEIWAGWWFNSMALLRRLGFTDDEVMGWCRAAGLVDANVRHLSASAKSRSDKLTVSLWTSIQSRRAPSRRRSEAA